MSQKETPAQNDEMDFDAQFDDAALEAAQQKADAKADEAPEDHGDEADCEGCKI